MPLPSGGLTAQIPHCALLWKFNKYTLTRVFMHAEFISGMKTVQNPTVFMKTQK